MNHTKKYNVTQSFYVTILQVKGSCILALHEAVPIYEHKLRHIGLNRHLKTYTKDPKIYMSILATGLKFSRDINGGHTKHKLRHIGTMPP